MKTHNTFIRICYADTDQMGFVYYGNYAKFFEIARTEAIRHIGVSYKDIENQNIVMPVSELKVKYVKPAYYDDTIRIESLPQFPLRQHKITFFHKVYNQHNTLLARAEVTLFVVDKKNMRPTFLPDDMIRLFENYYLPSSQP